MGLEQVGAATRMGFGSACVFYAVCELNIVK